MKNLILAAAVSFTATQLQAFDRPDFLQMCREFPDLDPQEHGFCLGYVNAALSGYTFGRLVSDQNGDIDNPGWRKLNLGFCLHGTREEFAERVIQAMEETLILPDQSVTFHVVLAAQDLYPCD